MQVADLLLPFLPDTAKYIHDMFESGVVKDQGRMLPRFIITRRDPRAPKAA